jgi:hypothetical protein
MVRDTSSDGGSRSRPGFLQSVFQFFTSVTGMITALIGLLGAVVALAATQLKESSPSSSNSVLTVPPQKVSKQTSISKPITPAAASSYLDLIEVQITRQLQIQLQAQVPDATVSVDSVDCSAAGYGGTCVAAASDSLGNNVSLKIAYTITDAATGTFIWRTTG